MMQNEELSRHRILFLGGEVTAPVAENLIAGFLLLDAQDHQAPIDLYINCPGGSVSGGMAIIDTMRCIRAPIHTVCVGLAASMAAWILAAGSRGQRRVTPNAEIMIHQMSTRVTGHATDIQVQARQIERLQERMVGLLADWTGQTPDKVREDMDRDFYMTAAEARTYGLVDEILEPYPK